MATLSSLLNAGTATPIGTYVPIMFGEFTTTSDSYAYPTITPPSTLFGGKYVRTGYVYLQAEYPLLFQLLGHSSGVTYNTSTEFYVPTVYGSGSANALSGAPSSKWSSLNYTTGLQYLTIGGKTFFTGHSIIPTIGVKAGRAGVMYYMRAK